MISVCVLNYVSVCTRKCIFVCQFAGAPNSLSEGEDCEIAITMCLRVTY